LHEILSQDFPFFFVLQVIEGNSNTYLASKRELDPPVWASRIRFLPYSYHRRTVCMRVEVYGCYWNGTPACLSFRPSVQPDKMQSVF
jgi:hypothetical protein